MYGTKACDFSLQIAQAKTDTSAWWIYIRCKKENRVVAQMMSSQHEQQLCMYKTHRFDTSVRNHNDDSVHENENRLSFLSGISNLYVSSPSKKCAAGG